MMSEALEKIEEASGAIEAPELSAWAQEKLSRLAKADLEQRKEIALEVRDEVRTAVQCYTVAERSMFEIVLLVELEKLYLEMGYGSTEEWMKQEVAPGVRAGRATLCRMKLAAVEYRRLAEKYPEPKAQWTLLAMLEGEERRQREGCGRLTAGEFGDVEKRVAEGSIKFRELEVMLRARRKDEASVTGVLAKTLPTGDVSARKHSETGPVRLTGSEGAQGEGHVSARKHWGAATDPLAEVKRLTEDVMKQRGSVGAVKSVPATVKLAVGAGEEFRRVLDELVVAPVDAFDGLQEPELSRLQDLLDGLHESVMTALEQLERAVACRSASAGCRGASVVADIEEGCMDEFVDPFEKVA